MEKDLQNRDNSLKAALPPEGVGADSAGVADAQSAGTDVEDLQKEVREQHDKMLRIAAEFENYKKRMERERLQLLKYAEENLLRDLLPTLDNLERALEQGRAAAGPALLEGVELTLSVFLQTLEKFGIKALDSLGQPFDPTRHDALCMEATDVMEPNKILKEFQKGYFYQDRLLRAAKVVVSQAMAPVERENKEI